MLQKPEESQHINTGPGSTLVEYNGQTVSMLVRKKDRVLLYTADAGIGRAAGLPVAHKGDFLGWVPVAEVKPVAA